MTTTTTRRILLSPPDVTDVEERFVLDALRSGWVAPLGPDVDAFEREVAARTGVAHALALSSGTAALHLALLGVGAREGRVVVLPTMTFAASANAVLYTGAEPVFVDCRPEDGNVDPQLLVETVDELIGDGADVCAAMTVDLFGRSCDYSQIEPALRERGVALVEDAAEALGASHAGRPAGSFGQAAALSFNGNKIMTTSGGGMLLSDDEELVLTARRRATQAREPVPWYEHTEVGYNYRLSNLLAALGRGQLSRLDSMIARRREIRRRYAVALADLPVRLLDGATPDHAAEADNCWLTTLTVEDPAVDVDSLIAQVNADGVEVRHLWKPMHRQPVFASYRSAGGAVSEQLFRTGVTLPSGSTLTDEDVDRVVATLRDRMAEHP